MAEPLEEIKHVCADHHQPMPLPEIIIPDSDRKVGESPDRLRMRESFDLDELAVGIDAILDNSRETTSKELFLRHEFASTCVYSHDIDDMTVSEIYDLLDSIMCQLDTYFFHGWLTQGPTPLVKLVIKDLPSLRPGSYQRMQYVSNRIIIFLRDAVTGDRREKLDLVDKLISLMIVAFIVNFLTRCPEQAISNDELTKFEEEKHLFMILAISEWHPQLKDLNVDRDWIDELDFFSEWYYKKMEQVRVLRDEWEGTHEGGELPWWMRGYSKEKRVRFKSAMLQASFPDYRDYVAAMVPYPETAWLIWVLTVLVLVGVTLVVARGMWSCLAGFVPHFIFVARRMGRVLLRYLVSVVQRFVNLLLGMFHRRVEI
ncbi:hypothetical protein F4808DRAFT_8349 [Astrocystis sublimbata]|nr:hypothetical protein F4808DRAFT_8349 [Astrocystis sublimbata]